jgi:hypothetical protein
MYTHSLITILFIHLDCLAQVRKAPLLICSLCFGVFLEKPAFLKHTPKCSSTPKATNYAKRTCDEVKENLREATKNQLACRLWKSGFLKKLL